MRTTWIALVGILMLAQGCADPVRDPVSDMATPDRQQPVLRNGTAVKDRITIHMRFRPGAPANARALLRSEGAEYVTPAFLQTTRISVSVSRQRAASLQRLPWLEVVEIDSAPRPRVTSETVPWGIDTVGAALLHSTYANKGAGIKIAMLDDGIQCDHPDLDARIEGGYDFIDDDSNYCTPVGLHGTKTAGVLVAEMNSSQVVGMAPDADLYVLRVCDTGGDCEPAAIIDAIEWAVNNDMDVITASFGDCGTSSPSQTYLNVSQDAYDANIPQAFAAGNGGCHINSVISSWAQPSTVLAVTAHGSGGTYINGYQYSSQVDLSAPTNVTTTTYNAGTGTYDGTSAATPHVGGALALLKAAGFDSTAKVYQRITETAFDAGTSGVDNYYGHGRLRVFDAAVPRPVVTGFSWCYNSGNITGAGNCTFSLSTNHGVGTVQAMFTVWRSDVPNDSTIYGWGSTSRSISVGSGNYSLTVKVRLRDASPYYRLSYAPQTQEVSVCTGGGGSIMFGGGGEEAQAQCGGGGEEN